MKAQYLKYYIGIFLIFAIDSLHYFFYESEKMYDVYFLYDYDRYLVNIIYDVSNLFRFSILCYWLINLNKRIFKPLFYTSLFIWLSYFLTYNQSTSLLIIPIYIISVLTHNRELFKR